MTCPRPHRVDFGSRFWAQFGLLCLRGNVFKGVSWSLGWRVRQSELLLHAHTSVASFLIPVSSLFLAHVQIMQRCRITHRREMEVSLPQLGLLMCVKHFMLSGSSKVLRCACGPWGEVFRKGWRSREQQGLGAILSFTRESFQPLGLHFFLESFLSFLFWILYLTGIITFWFSWNASALGGKWKAGVNALSLLRDLESYYCMVLAFCVLVFNAVVYMELRNV